MLLTLTACSGSFSMPTVNAVCEGLRGPLVAHVEEIVGHQPHEDVRVSGAKVVAVYRAGCPQ
jgi:hypothetical protein